MRWLLLACALCATPVRAETIWIRGEITRQMSDQIVARKPHSPLRLILSSAGGALLPGREIALVARATGAEAIVVDECSSACVVILASAAVRWMVAGSRLGFHGIVVAGEPAPLILKHQTALYADIVRRASAPLGEMMPVLLADPRQRTYLGVSDLLAIDPGFVRPASAYDAALDRIVP